MSNNPNVSSNEDNSDSFHGSQYNDEFYEEETKTNRSPVGDDRGPSNHNYVDANLYWSPEVNALASRDDVDEEEEEYDDNASAPHSMDDNRSNTGAPRQEGPGDRAHPSHDNRSNTGAPRQEGPGDRAHPSHDNRSNTGAPRQESPGHRADPSHDNVKPEATSAPTAQSQHVPSKVETENVDEHKEAKVQLHQAALKDDWNAAKYLFDLFPSIITSKITANEETALHIAVAACHIHFVENLVEELTANKDNLTAQNRQGNTALAFAAASGVVRIAEVIVNKNSELPNLSNRENTVPIFMAISYKRERMASYLFSKTKFESLPQSEQTQLLIATISADYYDIALKILKTKPELAVERMKNGDTALHVLARKPSAIGSSSKLGFWKRHINSRFNRIYNKALMQTLAHQTVENVWKHVVKHLSTKKLFEFIETPSRLLHDAASVGNAEFLIILIRLYPDTLWRTDEEVKSIFHIAVKNRQERVFRLIYEIGGLKDFLANFYDKENILHLAGSLPDSNHLSRVSGAALQMQRELLWFKEVEKIVLSTHRWMKSPIPEPSQVKLIGASIDIQKQFEELLNSREKSTKTNKASPWILMAIPELSEVKVVRDAIELTPRELFTKEHKELKKSGEEWMKTTANSCMLVATLIATVVFAAAFTVPGGHDDKEGVPIFRQNKVFTVFVIADGAALVLSIISILTFLSILTSRYDEDDFLASLPRRLLIGIFTLSFSMAGMVVAFSATFFIVYDKTKTKIPYAIAAVAIALPIWCFYVFFSKLVMDICSSFCWSFSLRHRKKKLF